MGDGRWNLTANRRKFSLIFSVRLVEISGFLFCEYINNPFMWLASKASARRVSLAAGASFGQAEPGFCVVLGINALAEAS
jgi:hypothetical protein